MLPYSANGKKLRESLEPLKLKIFQKKIWASFEIFPAKKVVILITSNYF